MPQSSNPYQSPAQQEPASQEIARVGVVLLAHASWILSMIAVVLGLVLIRVSDQLQPPWDRGVFIAVVLLFLLGIVCAMHALNMATPQERGKVFWPSVIGIGIFVTIVGIVFGLLCVIAVLALV